MAEGIVQYLYGTRDGQTFSAGPGFRTSQDVVGRARTYVEGLKPGDCPAQWLSFAASEVTYSQHGAWRLDETTGKLVESERLWPVSLNHGDVLGALPEGSMPRAGVLHVVEFAPAPPDPDSGRRFAVPFATEAEAEELYDNLLGSARADGRPNHRYVAWQTRRVRDLANWERRSARERFEPVERTFDFGS